MQSHKLQQLTKVRDGQIKSVRVERKYQQKINIEVKCSKMTLTSRKDTGEGEKRMKLVAWLCLLLFVSGRAIGSSWREKAERCSNLEGVIQLRGSHGEKADKRMRSTTRAGIG